MNRKLIFLVLALGVALAATAPVARANGTAVITLLDGFQNPITNTQCRLTYFSAPYSSVLGTSVQWRGSACTDTSGQITLTNCSPGFWQVKALSLNAVAFSFLMPATNGTVLVQSWTTADAGATWPPNNAAFSTSASDLRYDAAGQAFFWYTNNPNGYQTVGQVTNLIASLADAFGAAQSATNGLATSAFVPTNTFYNVGASGFVDSLYNFGLGGATYFGWLEIVTNVSGSSVLTDVAPFPVNLQTALGYNQFTVPPYVDTFAAYSSTNQFYVFGAGITNVNCSYSWSTNGWYTNLQTAASITVGSPWIIKLGGTNLYWSVNVQALFGTVNCPTWSTNVHSSVHYYGTGTLPGSAWPQVIDYSQNYCVPTNQPSTSLTATGTNGVQVPISAHITNGVVYWTAP